MGVGEGGGGIENAQKCIIMLRFMVKIVDINPCNTPSLNFPKIVST
jgi:hypothetical protein